jgi:hypothetical protein
VWRRSLCPRRCATAWLSTRPETPTGTRGKRKYRTYNSRPNNSPNCQNKIRFLPF